MTSVTLTPPFVHVCNVKIVLGKVLKSDLSVIIRNRRHTEPGSRIRAGTGEL